jgi:hypothetical protein
MVKGIEEQIAGWPSSRTKKDHTEHTKGKKSPKARRAVTKTTRDTPQRQAAEGD